jgi:hypothetical protein
MDRIKEDETQVLGFYRLQLAVSRDREEDQEYQ